MHAPQPLRERQALVAREREDHARAGGNGGQPAQVLRHEDADVDDRHQPGREVRKAQPGGAPARAGVAVVATGERRVGVGDRVQVEVLEGRKRTLELTVDALYKRRENPNFLRGPNDQINRRNDFHRLITLAGFELLNIDLFCVIID